MPSSSKLRERVRTQATANKMPLRKQTPSTRASLMLSRKVMRRPNLWVTLSRSTARTTTPRRTHRLMRPRWPRCSGGSCRILRHGPWGGWQQLSSAASSAMRRAATSAHRGRAAQWHRAAGAHRGRAAASLWRPPRARQQDNKKDAMTVQSEAAGQQGAMMLQPWGGINPQAKYSRAQVPVSKEVPACSHMRLAEGPGDDEHHLVQKAQRLPSPGLQGASWERETKVDEEWEQVRQSEGSGNCPGWTSTSSVLSAIVATQAATEKPVWGPAALR